MKILAYKRLQAASLLDRFEKFAGALKGGYQKIKGIECEVHADESSEDGIVLSTYDKKDANKLVRLLRSAGFKKARVGKEYREDGLDKVSVLVQD